MPAPAHGGILTSGCAIHQADVPRPGEDVVRDRQVLMPARRRQPGLEGVHQVQGNVAADQRQVGHAW